MNDHAQLGNDVRLRHGVTIGHAKPTGGSPVIEDGVDIGAGACIIGDITVGAHSVIGAGAVLTKSVPPRSLVIGNPATVRELKREQG